MSTSGKHRLPLTPAQEKALKRKKRGLLGAVLPLAAGGGLALLVSLLPGGSPAHGHAEIPRSAAATAPASHVSPPLRVPHRAAPPAPAAYTVRQGQALWSIARDACGDGNKWKALARANHLTRPWLVTPGEKITVACA